MIVSKILYRLFIGELHSGSKKSTVNRMGKLGSITQEERRRVEDNLVELFFKLFEKSNHFLRSENFIGVWNFFTSAQYKKIVEMGWLKKAFINGCLRTVQVVGQAWLSVDF